jgi:hypothetical protein
MAIIDFGKATELKPDYGRAYWARGDAKRLMRRVGYCEDYQKAAERHVSEGTEAWLKYCQVTK